MTLTVDDIPVCPADPAELRRLAASLETAGSATTPSVHRILFTWGLLASVYRAPEADELQQSLQLLSPAAQEIATGLRGARAAIDTLADDLEAVNRRRDTLVEEMRNRSSTAALQLVAPDDDLGVRLEEAALAAQRAAFRRECEALVEGWDAAAHACAAALRAIPDVSWTLARSLPADDALLAAPSASIIDEAAIPLLQRLARGEGADAARLLRENPEWAAIIRRGEPEAVATWWASLPASTAAVLVTGVPALIGNLDGVALEDRVAANRARAAGRLAELQRRREETLLEGRRPLPRSGPDLLATTTRVAAIDREIAYFRAVHAGEKQLYAWDPDHGSLIEMSGDPSTAKAALFVVPGTNTTADSFYGGDPITGFADWQVEGGRGEVLAFTVMTGPMPQLGDIPLGGGPQWNRYADERAPEYADFLRGVQGARPDLWTMSYEHSYGGSVGSSAERVGGTVDTRFLAASVGATDGYIVSPHTTYFSAQGPDDINRYYAGLQAGPLGFGVGPESFDGVHIVDSGLPGVNPVKAALGVPLVVADSVAHHNALMSDDEEINGKVLNSVKSILKTRGHLE